MRKNVGLMLLLSAQIYVSADNYNSKRNKIITLEKQLEDPVMLSMILNSQNINLMENNKVFRLHLKTMRGILFKILKLIESPILNRTELVKELVRLTQKLEYFILCNSHLSSIHHKLRKLLYMAAEEDEFERATLMLLVNELLTEFSTKFQVIGPVILSFKMPNFSENVSSWEKNLKDTFLPLFNLEFSFLRHMDANAMYLSEMNNYVLTSIEKQILEYIATHKINAEEKTIVLDILYKYKSVRVLTKIFRQKQEIEHKYFLQTVVNTLNGKSTNKQIIVELTNFVNISVNNNHKKNISLVAGYAQNCKFYQTFVNDILHQISDYELQILIDKLQIPHVVSEFIDATRRFQQYRSNFLATLMDLEAEK